MVAPSQTYTFDNAITGTPITNQYPGIAFQNTFGSPDSVNSYPHINGGHIGDFIPFVGGTGLFSATFTNNLSQVGFAFISAPGTTTFKALLGGSLVEMATAATDPTNANNFFGFTGIVFDKITISTVSFDNVFLLDNLQVRAVPEPGSMALVMVALAGLGLRYRSLRRSAGA